MRPAVLIFGGTSEARGLAHVLEREGFAAITSLAGITGEPAQPAGRVVSGGLGGAEGITDFLRREHIAAMVDATHPFAARIAAKIESAAVQSGIPCFRLERPPWEPEAGDRWIGCDSARDALNLAVPHARIFLALGRSEAAAFVAHPDLAGVVRMIESPDFDIPPRWQLIRERAPFTVEHEDALIANHQIRVLVCKNSGGDLTRAKLVAARNRNVPVIMLRRPARPAAPTFADPALLVATLRDALRP